MTETPLTAEHLAALDRAAMEQTAAREDTGVSYAFGDKEQTFRAELARLYRTNQLVLIGPDAVERCAAALYRAMNGHMATAWSWDDLEADTQAFWRDKATATIAALTGRV